MNEADGVESLVNSVGDGNLSQIGYAPSKRLRYGWASFGLLSILVDWPDPSFLGARLSRRTSKHVSCFAPQPAEWIHPEELLATAPEDSFRILRSVRPSEFDDCITQPGGNLRVIDDAADGGVSTCVWRPPQRLSPRADEPP